MAIEKIVHEMPQTPISSIFDWKLPGIAKRGVVNGK